MELLAELFRGFGTAFGFTNLIVIFFGCVIGILVGALPGISAVNGIALMLPLIYAFNLPPESALILLSAIYYGSEYGTSASSILLNIPGKALHFTRLDGYPLACEGQAGKALLLSAIASFSGGMLALLVLTFLKPLLKVIASQFGPAEYFAIIMFVFVVTLILIGTSLVKNLIGLCLGLVLAIVGLDPATGVLRFGFDTPELYDGIDFIIVVIGLYTVGDALLIMEENSLVKKGIQKVEVSRKDWYESIKQWPTIIRASLIGFMIGGMPGTGTSIAGVTAYRAEKKVVSDHHKFGQGDLRGVAASESAGSAASFSAFIPLLILGIPGSATTAVLLGAMLMMNLNPGPMFYSQQSDLVWVLIASMFLGCIILVLLNIYLIRFFSRIVLIPQWVLIPVIIVIAFVGVYAIQGSLLSLMIMLILGIISYVFRKLDYSLVPVILGYILGGPLEVHLRRALAISGGEIEILFQSNLTRTLWVIICVGILLKLFRGERLSI